MRNNCFYCGQTYDAARSNQLFCSSWCRYKDKHRGPFVLTLKKKWFDMILSGEKKEDDGRIPLWLWNDQSKEILFKNGYGNDAPYFTEECTIREGSGNEEWGTETGKKYYILEIRKIT